MFKIEDKERIPLTLTLVEQISAHWEAKTPLSILMISLASSQDANDSTKLNSSSSVALVCSAFILFFY